jgi:hypothetical protein
MHCTQPARPCPAYPCRIRISPFSNRRTAPLARRACQVSRGSKDARKRADMYKWRVRGGTDPVSPHCSMSYSAEINL